MRTTMEENGLAIFFANLGTQKWVEPGTILDRAYFPARVERVPQDVNQLRCRNLRHCNKSPEG